MGVFNHNRRTKVFKGLVAVVYFALFTAQLSCRFHICANFPIYHVAKNSPEVAVLGDVDKVGHQLILSIDKRYELGHAFALVTPVFQLEPRNSTDLHNATVCQPHHRSAIIYLHSLRGPPIA